MIPILDALAKTEDVRPFIQQIVSDDRIMYAKASTILSSSIFGGGKHRSSSQAHMKEQIEVHNKIEHPSSSSSSSSPAVSYFR
jgi:hypothetical protein